MKDDGKTCLAPIKLALSMLQHVQSVHPSSYADLYAKKRAEMPAPAEALYVCIRCASATSACNSAANLSNCHIDRGVCPSTNYFDNYGFYAPAINRLLKFNVPSLSRAVLVDQWNKRWPSFEKGIRAHLYLQSLPGRHLQVDGASTATSTWAALFMAAPL